MQYFPKTHQYNLVSIMHRFRQCFLVFALFGQNTFQYLSRRQLKFLFYGQSAKWFRVGRPAGIVVIIIIIIIVIIIIIIIIIIRSVRVNTSKKNINHRVKLTCTIMSRYKTELISLLCDSSISSLLKFFLFCCSLKEKDVRKK